MLFLLVLYEYQYSPNYATLTSNTRSLTIAALVCAQNNRPPLPFGAELNLTVNPGQTIVAGQSFTISWTRKDVGGRGGPGTFGVFAVASNEAAFSGTRVMSVLDTQNVGQITISQPGYVLTTFLRAPGSNIHHSKYRLIAVNDGNADSIEIFTYMNANHSTHKPY